MKRYKGKKEIKRPEVAVFCFSKGSQFNNRVYECSAYQVVHDAIDVMMKKSFVESDKVGISGYKEDVVAYIAGLINYYLTSGIEISLMDDINEYDPDIDVPYKKYQ
jgi:hypothetical protein